MAQAEESFPPRRDVFLGGEGGSGGGGVPASSVNKAIQMLAQKYCVECKTSFDELSKIIQVVSYSHIKKCWVRNNK